MKHHVVKYYSVCCCRVSPKQSRPINVVNCSRHAYTYARAAAIAGCPHSRTTHGAASRVSPQHGVTRTIAALPGERRLLLYNGDTDKSIDAHDV